MFTALCRGEFVGSINEPFFGRGQNWTTENVTQLVRYHYFRIYYLLVPDTNAMQFVELTLHSLIMFDKDEFRIGSHVDISCILLVRK